MGRFDFPPVVCAVLFSLIENRINSIAISLIIQNGLCSRVHTEMTFVCGMEKTIASGRFNCQKGGKNLSRYSATFLKYLRKDFNRLNTAMHNREEMAYLVIVRAYVFYRAVEYRHGTGSKMIVEIGFSDCQVNMRKC